MIKCDFYKKKLSHLISNTTPSIIKLINVLSNTCPKGFGLKLAKLGLEIPLKSKVKQKLSQDELAVQWVCGKFDKLRGKRETK